MKNLKQEKALERTNFLPPLGRPKRLPFNLNALAQAVNDEMSKIQLPPLNCPAPNKM